MARKGKVDHLSGIVFVEQRYIAFALHLVLKHAIKLDPDRFGFINPDYVIGNSSNSLESKASEETHKRLEKVRHIVRI